MKKEEAVSVREGHQCKEPLNSECITNKREKQTNPKHKK